MFVFTKNKHNQSDRIFKNMTRDGIWNCRFFLENNVSKACILTIFKTIWNCREKMKTMSLKNAFWHYLKRFRTAVILENNVSKACILTIFKTIWNCREHFENNVSKECMPLFLKTMSLKHVFWLYLKRFGTSENILKTMSVKHAFWQYLRLFGTAENFLKTMF